MKDPGALFGWWLEILFGVCQSSSAVTGLALAVTIARPSTRDDGGLAGTKQVCLKAPHQALWRQRGHCTMSWDPFSLKM